MFIRNEQKEVVEIYSDNQDIFARPVANESWELIVTDEDGEELDIGIFDNVEEANSALISLRSAVEDDLGWDFNYYRNKE